MHSVRVRAGAKSKGGRDACEEGLEKERRDTGIANQEENGCKQYDGQRQEKGNEVTKSSLQFLRRWSSPVWAVTTCRPFPESFAS